MGRWADGTLNPSVIYASYLQNGLPVLPNSYAIAAQQAPNECLHEDYAPVAQWLKRGGVRTVIVGHQPNGDAPFILRDEKLDIQVLSALLMAAAPESSIDIHGKAMTSMG